MTLLTDFVVLLNRVTFINRSLSYLSLWHPFSYPISSFCPETSDWFMSSNWMHTFYYREFAEETTAEEQNLRDQSC